MQNKRPPGAPTAAPSAPGTFSAQDTPVTPAPATAVPPEVPSPGGRTKRVRNRLVIGVAVVGLIVTGAGVPGLLDSTRELRDAQNLVTLAELNRQAVTLAHSLSDERDEVTAYIAAGRDEQSGDRAERRKVTAARSARVDRQIEEIRGSIPDERDALRRDLATVPSVRRAALTGKGTALEAHRAYTTVIGNLHALAAELAERTPPRAADGTRAPAELSLAVEQASATRGLLLAALAVPGAEPEYETDYFGRRTLKESDEQKAAAEISDALSALAQQARVREEAALADFDQAARKSDRDSLLATVTGAEVKAAEGYLARLTDEPGLSAEDRGTDARRLEAALTARIEQMRGVESALAAQRITALEELRDDDVTELELRIALLGGLLLLAVAVLAALLRTITRPLSVLRRGAARIAAAPEAEDPVGFTGRNDEFAQAVRSLNTLHGKVRGLDERARVLESARAGLAGDRDTLATELAAERADAHRRVEELTAEVERLRHTVDHTFVNLSLRNLGLVDRQLSVIEKLEEREQDPERLATLFKLDHMATVMRRHSENLLVLAGAEHSHGHPNAVPLVDVLRAAVSEIERYERVVIQSLPPHAQVAGFAADDLSHLLAELLENATSFSPPETKVELSGWLLENGEVMLSVRDNGIGMAAGRIAELNGKLEDPAAFEESGQPVPAGKNKKGAKGGGKNGASGRTHRTGKGGRSAEPEGLGLRVTALLAARHGVRVQLRDQQQGGVTAVVVLPVGLLPRGAGADRRDPLTDSGSMPAVRLPGSVAEANSNALPTGPRQAPDRARGIAAASGDSGPADTGRDLATGLVPPVDNVPVDLPVGGPVGGGPAELPVGPTTSGTGTGPGLTADAAPDPDPAEPPYDTYDTYDDTPGTLYGNSRYDDDPYGPTVSGIGTGVGDDLTDTDPPPGAFVPMTDPLVEAAEAAVRAAEPDVHTRTADGDPAVTGLDQATFEMRLPDPGDLAADPFGAGEPAGNARAGEPARPAAPEHPDDERGFAAPVTPADSAGDEGPAAPAEPSAPTGPGEPGGYRLTDKGLPKRTPRVVRPATDPGERRSGGVDAAALRRRLGGFQKAAEDGRREARDEIARTAAEEEAGDTVEEARS
ncbi:nitrate- and nitrite sensing domain-containing protein [Streptomyces sp. NPDC006798]|uniref:sensor histidine kinase n=1 Tax=Streptomyces sp. NPDC006798 TaxID=3155462 RepID=UPI0033F57DC5